MRRYHARQQFYLLAYFIAMQSYFEAEQLNQHCFAVNSLLLLLLWLCFQQKIFTTQMHKLWMANIQWFYWNNHHFTTQNHKVSIVLSRCNEMNCVRIVLRSPQLPQTIISYSLISRCSFFIPLLPKKLGWWDEIRNYSSVCHVTCSCSEYYVVLWLIADWITFTSMKWYWFQFKLWHIWLA